MHHRVEKTRAITMASSLFCCCGKRSASSAAKDDNAGEEDEGEAARDGPVVVELFSSQGCATSPEAELLLSRIGRGGFNLELPPLVLLAFHVDYWDYTGWKDPFGCSQWTVRQKAYVESLQLDTMFTPLLVVQSQAQCVGNDQDAVLTSIKSAPRFPPLSFQANFEKPTPDTLEVSLTGTLRNKVDSNGANIMVVLFECGLVTQCEEGENKGKVLANDYVVRRLEKLCEEVKDISGKKTLSGTVKFSLWESFNTGKCGMAVFMENGCHHILGSQKFQLPYNL